MLTIVVIIYQIAITSIDFAKLVFALTWSFMYPVWRIFNPPKLKSLSNDVILVTGAAKGLGKELALQLAQHGATIICIDILKEHNEQTANIILKQGGTAYSYTCDVSSYEEVQDLTSKIIRDIGDVSIVINNAGIVKSKRMTEVNPKDVVSLFENNVYSNFWMIIEWLPRMVQRNHGHIVSISSLAGEIGIPHLAPYCATKYAITGMMDSLTEELRSRHRNPNIKFTTIIPAIIQRGSGPDKMIRFPSILSCVSYTRCAEMVVQGIRQEAEKVTIPQRYFYMLKIYRLLPKSVQNSILDLLNSGVDEDGFNTRAA